LLNKLQFRLSELVKELDVITSEAHFNFESLEKSEIYLILLLTSLLFLSMKIILKNFKINFFEKNAFEYFS